MYKLFVIPGSHACRSAMLMLEHKRVPYRRVDFVPTTHPVMARLNGLDAGGQKRTAGNRRTWAIRLGDRLGTVPGLAANGQRVPTNHNIARFLEERHPEPPLFPADPDRRREVEEAERWANGPFQMTTRRVTGAGMVLDPVAFARSSGRGRMGPLLYRRERARRLAMPMIARFFDVGPSADARLIAEFVPMLDRVDAWIEAGLIGGEELNVADFMIAPALALVLYRQDVMPLFEGRPSLELVDRLLPAPAA